MRVTPWTYPGEINASAWTNKDNGLVNNGSYAEQTVAAGVDTGKYRGRDYGFAIPTTATILGVEIRVEHKDTGNNALLMKDCYLVLAGFQRGDDKWDSTTEVPNTDTVQTEGGATDTWNYPSGITPAIVNDSTFGVEFVYVGDSSGGTVYIDYVQMRIFYTGSETPGFFGMNF